MMELMKQDGGEHHWVRLGPVQCLPSRQLSLLRAGLRGSTMPECQLAMMDGNPISISDQRGNPSVIVFLTAWCPACKEESPHINRLTAEYEANGMTDYFGNELLDDNEMRLDRLLVWQR
jgi:thiol-disulfide isomerase/thioredoxin